MKNIAIISQTVQDKHKEIYDEIKRLMEERFDQGQYKIIGFEELPDDPDKVGEFLRTDVRFVCAHTDDFDDVALWVDDICECAVPTIVLKGDIPGPRLIRWKSILKRLTKERDKPLREVDVHVMFYAIPESQSNVSEAVKAVRGAVMWVNNFYHALKDAAVQAELGELQRAYGMVASGSKKS